MKLQVIKRGGRLPEDYNPDKISLGIVAAMNDIGKIDYEEAKYLADCVTDRISKWDGEGELVEISTEEIKTEVISVLMDPRERNTSRELAISFIGYVAVQRRDREQSLIEHGIENDAKLTDIAMKVFTQRYSHNRETPLDMFKRVAGLGKTTSERNEFYRMMSSFDFLPNTPTLMNYSCRTRQLSACFVLPIEDSLSGIMDTLSLAMQIQKSGGGTGFSFSRLRPKGSIVNTTGHTVSGVIPWIQSYNTVIGNIDQGGARKGANMGVLRIDHPDIIDFITCKENKSVLTNFNMSVGMTDKFMKAATSDKSFDLINPHTLDVSSTMNASKVLDLISFMTWKNGEPGVLFLDTINSTHPTVEGRPVNIEATNPCGEQPLLPFESCNLGSINLTNFVDDNWETMDMVRLESVTRDAVIFLNRIIDANIYPDKRLRDAAHRTRKIGLGIMGLADALHMLGHEYGGHASLSFTGKVMKLIQRASHECSREHGFNNLTTTTIAPTGTLSLLANCSFGIEPIYSIKTTITGGYLGISSVVWNNVYKDAKARGIKRNFITAHEVPWSEHIKMQAVAQRYVDSSVSKTINMSNHATVQDVRGAIIQLWRSQCKGGTIYRDGSRDGQVLQSCPTGKCDV